MANNEFDIIIIGGGIAGAAAGAELSSSARVLILESEEQPGYHATGRSAAFFTTTYGNELSRKIGTVVKPFFCNPPADLTEAKLLHPRDSIFVAKESQLEKLEGLKAMLGDDVSSISADEICQRVPILKSERVEAGLLDQTGGELDSDTLFQAYLRKFRKNKGVMQCRSEVQSLSREGGIWHVEARNETYTASTVINAAGPWADSVANLAGLEGLGNKPLKRTAILLEVPDHSDISNWPMIVDVGAELYFKPDAGLVMVSPADEISSPACDAQPDELDVAITVDRFMTETSVQVRRVNHQWAGLRTFTDDRNPVVGFDSRSEGFFWLAGLGGFGIATAPALAKLTAYLIEKTVPEQPFTEMLEMIEDLSPCRLIGVAE